MLSRLKQRKEIFLVLQILEKYFNFLLITIYVLINLMSVSIVAHRNCCPKGHVLQVEFSHQNTHLYVFDILMHYVIDSLEHVQQRTKICQELIISWEINFAKLFNKLKYFTHISTFKNISCKSMLILFSCYMTFTMLYIRT